MLYLKKKPVFIEGPVELEQIEEVTETFAAGYTPTQIAKELNIKKFTPLMNNLEKAGVKVIYDPQAKGSSYMQGKIILNNLDTSLFLEEALHAGLDTLPKKEKTKLRKDVLKWYKQLVDTMVMMRMQKAYKLYLIDIINFIKTKKKQLKN